MLAFSPFWGLAHAAPPVAGRLAAELIARWSQILALPPPARAAAGPGYLFSARRRRPATPRRRTRPHRAMAYRHPHRDRARHRAAARPGLRHLARYAAPARQRRRGFL